MNKTPFLKSKLIIPDLPKQSLFCKRIKNIGIDENRLSILTAPAGFGKTTAVLICLANSRQHVKWYRMDGEDAFLPVFYSHLIETLFSGDTGGNIGSKEMLKGLQNIEENYLLLNAQIVQDAYTIAGTVKEKTYLVLDDFHNVSDNVQITDTVRYLVMNMPECFSIIITSRTPTGILGDKLLFRSDVKEIGASHLLFSKAETEELIIDKYKLNLDQDQLDFVFNSTEGWVAGIYMMCRGMDFELDEKNSFKNIKKKNIFFKTFLHRFLRDISEEKKQILLKLSVMEDFSIDELRDFFVLNKPEEFIQWIENSNLYIQKVQSYPDRYRFHALFRDALKELFFLATDKKTRLEFFVELANYYGTKNQRLAIRFFLMAEEKYSALDIVRQLSGELFKNGNPEEMFYIISEFSDDDIASDPYLLLFDGMMRVNIDRQKSLDIFLAAMDGFKRCKDYSFLMNTFGMLLVIAYQSNNFASLKKASKKLPVISLMFSGRQVCIKLLISVFIAFTGTDKLRYAKVLSHILDKFFIRDGMWDFSYLMIRGIYYYRSGNLDEAHRNMKKILEHPVVKSNEQWKIIGLVSCCNITFLRMDKQSMRDFAEEFYTLGEKYNSPFAIGYGYFISAYEQYRRGKISYAIDAIGNSIDAFNEYKGDLLVLENRMIRFLWKEKVPTKQEISEANDIFAKIKAEDPGHGLVEFGQVVLGVMHRRKKEFEQAEKYFLKALKACRKKRAIQSVAGICLQLAYLYGLRDYEKKSVKSIRIWEKYSKRNGFIYWKESDREALQEVLKLLALSEKNGTRTDSPPHTYADEQSINSKADEKIDIEVKLLGNFKISVMGNTINENDFKTRKVGGILKYMIFYGKEGHVSRDKLASVFWPESDAKAANTSLRVALYEMRKTLTRKGMGLEDDCGFILEKRAGFCLKNSVNVVRDIDIIEEYYRLLRGDIDYNNLSKPYLEEICRLYDGELFDGQLYDDKLLVAGEHYSSIFFESLYRLSKIYMDSRSFDKAETLLEKGLKIDPFNEKAYFLLFELYKKTEREERAEYLQKQFKKRFKKAMENIPLIKN